MSRTIISAGATRISLLALTAVGDLEPVAEVALDERFRARYELGAVLGSGATGMVCAARDLRMNRTVAVKLLRLSGAEQTERFLREGQLLARVRHPNVVPVFDLERLDGRPYIVTELPMTRGNLKANHEQARALLEENPELPPGVRAELLEGVFSPR